MFKLKKLLSAEQIRASDQYTIENKHISSIDLMEKAALAFVREMLNFISLDVNVLIVCGTGNNGGDGLAIARILRSKEFNVDVYIVPHNSGSTDFEVNKNKLREWNIWDSDVDLSKYDIIVDALLGTGITRPAKGVFAEIITSINTCNADIWSVDIPSGIHSDHMNINGPVVKADHVISFQRPKRVFFIPEADPFIKEWTVVDIELDEQYMSSLSNKSFILDDQISLLLKERRRFSHKGTYGHAAIIAGSKGKMGAAILATKACLRSGAGLVTGIVPNLGFDILQILIPEAMCIAQESLIENVDLIKNFTCIGIGPGLGVGQVSKDILEEIFSLDIDIPLILDADALNILSSHPEMMDKLPNNSILTPHPKEFSRLVGNFNSFEERLNKQLVFSKKYKVVMVVKDAHTIITDPNGNTYFNTSGNAGMATGGSGDVLLGIITGLRAQGYSAIESSLLGVYYHGIAGDEATLEKGQMAMIASDIVDNLNWI